MQPAPTMLRAPEPRHEPPRPAQSLQSRTTVVVLTAAAVLALLSALWIARTVVLLLLAGILFAVLLDTAAVWVEHRTRLARRWSLPLLMAAATAVLALGIWLRGPDIAEQASQLQQRLPAAARTVTAQLARQPWSHWLVNHGFAPEQLAQAANLLPRVTGFLSTTLGFLGSLIIILFLGVAIAADPGTYRGGLVRLFPPARRAAVDSVLYQLSSTLRWWLVARMASMAAVGVMVWLGLWALGVPLAGTLGALAALLAFIPNVGPFLSVIPPLLLAFTIAPRQALLVALLFWAVHAVEGLLITPLAEQAVVHLPPALTFSAQMFLAVVAGPVGIALAAPLTAAGMVLVRSVYLESIEGNSFAGHPPQRPGPG